MAVTKIHAIRSTIQKSVEYIANPHKTDNRILLDTKGCGLETAALDFEMDNGKSHKKEDPIPAYHLIQSFAPGEVTFEEAHAIGKQLAEEVLGPSRAYVLATHIDREHVHNHIIFCSTDYLTNQRYHDNKTSYRRIRTINDALCKEHGLTVIIPGLEKGKKYNEWQADKKNISYKFLLKRDIFDCIRVSTGYEDFLQKLSAKGYEIKGYELGENAPKYISFKPPSYGNFIRGSHKNLGKGYTKEEIIERIEKQIKSREEWIEKVKNLPLEEQNLIDTSKDKYIQSPALSNWASLRNLKIAAVNYARASSNVELTEKIRLSEEELKQYRKLLVSIDEEKRVLSEQIRYLINYLDTKEFYEAYMASKNREKYFMEHEREIVLYEGAENILKQYGITPSQEKLEELRNNLYELEDLRKSVRADNDELSKQIMVQKRTKELLDQFFHQEIEKDISERNENHKQKERGD